MRAMEQVPRTDAGRSGLPVDASFDAADWVFTSRTFRALDHTFAIRATDEDVGRYFATAFDAFDHGDEPSTVYSLRHDGPPDEPYLLYEGSRRISRHEDASVPASRLMWGVNRSAIASSPQHVLLHAAAVERDGVGVVLPAAMESGKTTLAAGLVQAGFRYLTDEAAAITPGTSRLVAYPKPLSVDRGSWGVLASLEPQVPTSVVPFLRQQWQVSPLSIRPDSVVGSAEPALVISPMYRAGAVTALEPVPRSEMILDLARQTFGFDRAPRRSLAVLAQLLERCDCYRLTVSDLTAACELVDRAVDQVRSAALVGAGGDGHG
jgi:hypothetical protein